MKICLLLNKKFKKQVLMSLICCLPVICFHSILLADTFTENFKNFNHIDLLDNLVIENSQLILKYTNQYTHADGKTPGAENVSQTTGDSQNFKMAVNKNGFIYLVWQDDSPGNNDIFVSRWNGYHWSGCAQFMQQSDNISSTAGSSTQPNLVLLKNGVPAICWHDTTETRYNIYYTQWYRYYWAKANNNPGYDAINNNTGVYTYDRFNMVLDHNKIPRVIYKRQEWSGGSNQDIWLARIEASGSWGRWSYGVTLGWSSCPNMIINPANEDHHIIYCDANSFGSPTDWELMYIKYTVSGQWLHADNITGGPEVVAGLGSAFSGSIFSYPLIEFNESGNPMLFWRPYTPANILYFMKWNGSSWTRIDNSTAGPETISSFNLPTGFNMDYFADFLCNQNKEPLIVYPSAAGLGNDIRFARGSGNQWVKADGSPGTDIVSTNSGLRTCHPQMALDDNENPYIVWQAQSGSQNEIYFSKWNGSQWTSADGITPGADMVSSDINFSSAYPQISINNNMPYIAWIDQKDGNNEIYFTKYSKIYESKGTIISKTINTHNAYLANATLSASYDLNNQDISFFLSRDGGRTWEPVQNKKLHSFQSKSAINNDLRWKIEFSTDSVNETPLVSKLIISYNTEADIQDISQVICYPVPFNPEKAVDGVLKFINMPSESTLKILSLSGREIRSFPKGSVGKLPYLNYYGITWDGRDNNKGKVNPGVYIYIAEDKDQKRKMEKFLIIKE